MKLYINIGSINAFQIKRFELVNFVHEIVDDPKKADLLLITRWQDDYLHDGLKAIFVPYTGLNRFPVDLLRKKNIQVINTHAKAHLVAERAFALTLTVLGKILPYHKALAQEGRWLTRENWSEEFWESLHGKKCGFIGMGHIASYLINYLQAFNCPIINLKRDQHKKMAKVYADSLEDLIIKSDIIYLTCTLNDETKDLINDSHLELLRGKVLINVARGQVINEDTLFKLLDDKVLYGAGIDVWYQYPTDKVMQPSKYDLSKFDNLVMSPHASCHAYAFKNDYYDDIFTKIVTYKGD